MLKLELQNSGMSLGSLFSFNYRTLGSYNYEDGTSYFGLKLENPPLDENIFYRDNPQEDIFIPQEALQHIGSLNV